MTPEDLTYLYSLTNEHRSMRYDLNGMRSLARALGNPHEKFKSVLIAGTNGKGSVAAFLSAMLPDAGLYTSPHLQRLNERIRIGEREIQDQDLKELFEIVRKVGAATYFEMMTAIAFLYFQHRVKFAVIEVGLGGRLDATNIVNQVASVITTIGLDHQQYLGNTKDEIANEKAGIVKGAEPVVIGPNADFSAIRDKAGPRLLTTATVQRNVRHLGKGRFEVDLRTPIRNYSGLRPRLPGRHQIDNMVIAIRTAECLDIPGADIERGVHAAVWPGRLESFPGTPSFLLDGAHNIAAAQALSEFLSEFYPLGVWMIFGVMADKDFEEMISILRPHVSRMVFTKAKIGRAKDPADLRQLMPGSHIEPTIEEAIEYARVHAPKGATVLICGSLYLVGEARTVLAS